MSTPVQTMIADIDRKIVHLTELRTNLAQFEIDFPHSAASLVPIETPAPRRGRTPGPKRRGPYKKRKTAKKAERTNERTKQGARQ